MKEDVEVRHNANEDDGEVAWESLDKVPARQTHSLLPVALKSARVRPVFNLRLKLVLSYLGVALGAILLLVIVVSLAVQNYFFSAQQKQLQSNAESAAQQIVQVYNTQAGGSWSNVPPLRIYGPYLFVIVDTGLNPHSSPDAAFFALNNSELRQALTQAVKGQEVQGTLQAPPDGNGFSGQYISVPLRSNGNIIGALLLAQPNQYPQGFSPYAFLANVDTAILIAGAIIAVIVVIFSLMLARQFTRPLESLTTAAEQMKGGNYAQRVAPPKSQDELGRLALTFNAMADTIEADVTELRRQEQLRRDMIANIAHDLVTPLTAIQGFSEALADDVISEPKARQETALLIGREVQRLRRLVSDMQRMTSLESGHVQLDIAPLNLHELLDELLAVIGPECEQAGITVHNEIAPMTPLVLADSDRITQVLLNLVDNARHHTHAGGKITIGARQENGFLTVWVRDTGSGIDSADLPYIFERFYRVDRARTGSTSGSGLGLSIVKAIITAHGGTIRAESTVNQGTTILFTLPLSPQESTNYENSQRIDPMAHFREYA
jgi:signal transduction histidine kinase